MNIILITTGKRHDLLIQSLDSMVKNAGEWEQHHLTVVVEDNDSATINTLVELEPADEIIINRPAQGASAARNIGASSIPKYRRQSHVCFLDDDVWCAPGWDERLMELSEFAPKRLVSGHGHPFNHAEPRVPSNQGRIAFGEPLLCSTVNFFMPWSMWDDVGYFVEPGGAGGSEDYDWCMRAKAKGYGFAVTDPHVIMHCGLSSSNGNKIVGYDEMMKQNDKLAAHYGVTGKVVYR